MKRSSIPVVLAFLLTAACADYGDEPEAEEVGESISGDNLELLASPFIRGFVAAGSGCATLGDPVINGDSITFILTDYIAEKQGSGVARATCDIAVEVQLPAGLTISLDDVVYRGFAGGSAARSTFFREYFFAGVFQGDRRFTVVDYNAAGTPRVIQNDSDEYLSEFGEFTALDEVLSVGASPCGGSATWRANTSLSVRNNTSASFSFAAIDTIDVTNEFFVTFRFGVPRRCP